MPREAKKVFGVLWLTMLLTVLLAACGGRPAETPEPGAAPEPVEEELTDSAPAPEPVEPTPTPEPEAPVPTPAPEVTAPATPPSAPEPEPEPAVHEDPPVAVTPEPADEPDPPAKPAGGIVDPGGEIAVAAPKPGLERTGTEKCGRCHKLQLASWAESAHARREPPLDCEDCHGPGSEYQKLSTMKDPAKARAAGLVDPDREFCAICHAGDWKDDMLQRSHAHKE